MPGYTDPQDLNRFSYVANNPLSYTDPTGHMRVVEGPERKGCSNSKYCQNGKPKPLEKEKTKKDKEDKNKGGGGHPLLRPKSSNSGDTLKWCELADCVLAGASVAATALTLVPEPHVAGIAFGVDVVVTVWAGLRTEEDFSQGQISQTRRVLLDGTGLFGLAPTTFGLGVSITNFLITLTGLPN